MNPALCSLAYVSRNALAGGPAELASQIQDILLRARASNQRHDVTGALLFSDGYFAQVLEGPAEAVEAIFETIQCDPRHADVTILHLHPVAERSFGKWSMAFGGIDGVSIDPQLGGQGMEQAGTILATDAGKQLLASLHSVVRRVDLGRQLDAGGLAGRPG